MKADHRQVVDIGGSCPLEDTGITRSLCWLSQKDAARRSEGSGGLFDGG